MECRASNAGLGVWGLRSRMRWTKKARRCLLLAYPCAVPEGVKELSSPRGLNGAREAAVWGTGGSGVGGKTFPQDKESTIHFRRLA